MPARIVKPDQWNLQELSLAERQGGPLDPAELEGMRVRSISAVNPYVMLIEEPPHHYSSVHSHSCGEVMIVLAGRMLLNGEWCEPGTIIAIDRDDEYWHATTDASCTVALMRPQDRGRLTLGADHRHRLAEEPAGEG